MRNKQQTNWVTFSLGALAGLGLATLIMFKEVKEKVNKLTSKDDPKKVPVDDTANSGKPPIDGTSKEPLQPILNRY